MRISGRLRVGRRSARTSTEAALLAMSRKQYLTPLDRFGPTRHVYGRVHMADPGVYLLVAPHLGPNDPVFAVGWARNDYWAVQVWGFDGHGFRNDYDPAAPAAGAPSLERLGWPHPLTYAETLARAKQVSKQPVMVAASYRFTDGGFESHVIHAAPRVEFHYDDPNPGPADTAAAIELRLGGRRWKKHLAAIRAESREYQQQND